MSQQEARQKACQLLKAEAGIPEDSGTSHATKDARKVPAHF